MSVYDKSIAVYDKSMSVYDISMAVYDISIAVYDKSMAVYTKITTYMLDALLTDYDVGALVAHKGIADGIQNTNYFVETKKGQFILTIYEDRDVEKDLDFFLPFMKHLAEKYALTPCPILRKDKLLISSIKDKPCALIDFAKGTARQEPSIEDCAQLGRAIAQLHLAGQDFGLTRNNALGFKSWEPLFNKLEPFIDEPFPQLNKIIKEELALITKQWHKMDGLPKGIIHGDLFKDNVLFFNQSINAILDFYFSCNDILIYDLAIAANDWCFEEKTFNTKKIRALFKGYQTLRPLQQDEIQAFPLLAKGATMRFLLTRLDAVLNKRDKMLGQPRNPLDCLQQLNFHKNNPTPKTYGII